MSTPILLVSLAPTFIFALVFLMMPRVREGILFGVSVPVEFAESAAGQSILARYRSRVLVVFFAAMIAGGAAVLRGQQTILTAVTIAEFPLYCWAWVWAWHQTQPFAVKVPLRRSASLEPANKVDGFSLSQLVALIPLLFASAYLRLHWSQIPARFSVHWRADGVPDGWSERTVAGVFGTVIVGAMLVLGIAILSWLVGRVSPHQARQMRPILAVASWMMSALFTAIALHPFSANPESEPRFIFWITAAGMVALISTLSYVMNLPLRDAANPWDGTPDSGWRWGLVYYNPADSAVLVKNRFGLGWTLNFASPQAKLVVAGTLLFTAIVIFIVLASVRVHS
ncbi:MAG TPA: DUF5808 domain-containing protein [Acidobacteriaceae bacterium]|jgi:uncharacterized membrane protein|nr:DUF5808 domain-containing protein [Acidobacteriaceae bacterium]